MEELGAGGSTERVKEWWLVLGKTTRGVRFLQGSGDLEEGNQSRGLPFTSVSLGVGAPLLRDLERGGQWVIGRAASELGAVGATSSGTGQGREMAGGRQQLTDGM